MMNKIQEFNDINNSFKTLSELDSFIKQINLLAHKSQIPAKNPKDLLRMIEECMNERKECGKVLMFRNELCRLLYKNSKEITDKQIV